MIDHYRALFQRYGWLEDRLRWIVVRPLDEELTVDDLLWRLNGGRDPEHRVVRHPREAPSLEDRPLFFLFEDAGAWGLFEFGHGFVLPDDALAELSEGARLWMTSWHFNGGWTLLYAADGRIRAWTRDFVFTEFRSEDGDPSVLAGFRGMLDGLGPEDFQGRRAAALAFIEESAGLRLEGDWLDADEATAIILDGPSVA
ncbi:hypothetical protein [Nonomuraea insulae]|uniref:SUKH-4 immunity protein of toxin-antitoxin system n=1 Tax=Nonomuraea insulae TaxID=1616787 RepID=A0ABW1D605_9ACTN